MDVSHSCAMSFYTEESTFLPHHVPRSPLSTRMRRQEVMASLRTSSIAQTNAATTEASFEEWMYPRSGNALSDDCGVRLDDWKHASEAQFRRCSPRLEKIFCACLSTATDQISRLPALAFDPR